MSRLKKLLLASAIVAVLGAGIGYYVLVPRGPIYKYDVERDTQKILDLFKSDWYWLVSSPDYSPEFMLKHRAPSKNPLHLGRLKIKVLRENNEFVGFIAYYMKMATTGLILFIAVEPEFRGKRYGEQLMRYALDDLVHLGAKVIRLTTRPANVSGQNLYKRIGFYETSRDEEFVHFEYKS